MSKLILIRHGQSVWNAENRFTGWVDVDLSEKLLISGAVRYEDFSDFGSNVSAKIASRYKLSNQSAVRASFSSTSNSVFLRYFDG